VLGAGIPLPEAVDWLASLGASVVVEFVGPEDPRARDLFARKGRTHPGYDRASFERLLGERFGVDRVEGLAGGTRVLYVAHPRS
jgi:hypothetical protein